MLLWLVYPLLSLLLLLCLVQINPSASYMGGIVLATSVMVEMMLEQYFMEGIFRVEENMMEYVKSAGKIEEVILGAMTAASVRRWIYYGIVIPSGAALLIRKTGEEEITFAGVICMIFAILISLETGTYIKGRFGAGNSNDTWLAGVFCSIAGAVLLNIVMFLDFYTGLGGVSAVFVYIVVFYIKRKKVKKLLLNHYCD